MSDAILTMETQGERLARLRTEKGLSQAKLAALVGFSGQGAIGNIERGTRGYGASIIDIARVLGTTPEYLRMEEASSSAANTSPGPVLRGKVPLISWVRAGEFSDCADASGAPDVERWMECPVNHSDSTYALRVRGDSMTAPSGMGRTYPEGCFIFVDPEKRSPVNGDRIVARLEHSNEVTFKIYKNEDGKQWLQPLNPQHEPIREKFRVLGTVLGKWEDG